MINYYNNIDELPLWNWLKINTGKLNYCRKDLEKGTEENDLISFELIKDSNYTEFGVSSDHLRLLELQLELSIARLDWVITGDNFINNKIIMLESEIDEIINSDEKGGDIDETIIILSKWMGSRVDTKIVTVKEFQKMISLLKKEVELSKNK